MTDTVMSRQIVMVAQGPSGWLPTVGDGQGTCVSEGRYAHAELAKAASTSLPGDLGGDFRHDIRSDPLNLMSLVADGPKRPAKNLLGPHRHESPRPGDAHDMAIESINIGQLKSEQLRLPYVKTPALTALVEHSPSGSASADVD